MNRTAIISIVVAVVILAGGGILLAAHNSSSQKDSMGNMNTNGSGNSSSSSKPVATSSVTIQGFAFGPASITVKKGTKVTWTNKDSAAHTVTQNTSTPGGPGLDSKGLAQGETYSATFDTVGTFKYYCTVHPNMTGTVTVTE